MQRIERTNRKNCSSQDRPRTLYAALVNRTRSKDRRDESKFSSHSRVPLCVGIAGNRHHPPSWVEATTCWIKWLLGRPLQRVLRSGASVGPGAGPLCPAPGEPPVNRADEIHLVGPVPFSSRLLQYDPLAAPARSGIVWGVRRFSNWFVR